MPFMLVALPFLPQQQTMRRGQLVDELSAELMFHPCTGQIVICRVNALS